MLPLVHPHLDCGPLRLVLLPLPSMKRLGKRMLQISGRSCGCGNSDLEFNVLRGLADLSTIGLLLHITIASSDGVGWVLSLCARVLGRRHTFCSQKKRGDG